MELNTCSESDGPIVQGLAWFGLGVVGVAEHARRYHDIHGHRVLFRSRSILKSRDRC